LEKFQPTSPDFETMQNVPKNNDNNSMKTQNKYRYPNIEEKRHGAGTPDDISDEKKMHVFRKEYGTPAQIKEAFSAAQIYLQDQPTPTTESVFAQTNAILLRNKVETDNKNSPPSNTTKEGEIFYNKFSMFGNEDRTEAKNFGDRLAVALNSHYSLLLLDAAEKMQTSPEDVIQQAVTLLSEVSLAEVSDTENSGYLNNIIQKAA
jgi:hypothetical protein